MFVELVKFRGSCLKICKSKDKSRQKKKKKKKRRCVREREGGELDLVIMTPGVPGSNQD